LEGAEKVIGSAPFKIKDKSQDPDDSTCLIYGINHIVRPRPASRHLGGILYDDRSGSPDQAAPGDKRDLTDADGFHVHDPRRHQYPERARRAPPKAAASDLRKNRSHDNIIYPPPVRQKALERSPEIKQVGFMADSVRIPTSTVSLIILNITFPRRSTLPDSQ
jgi:glyceraldehyde 3-phosphate dehydrogenase